MTLYPSWNILQGAGPAQRQRLGASGAELHFKGAVIEGSDIYQLLLIPRKNIVPSQNYRRSKVTAVQ